MIYESSQGVGRINNDVYKETNTNKVLIDNPPVKISLKPGLSLFGVECMYEYSERLSERKLAPV